MPSRKFPFAIEITGQDRITDEVARINTRIQRVLKPASAIRSSLALGAARLGLPQFNAALKNVSNRFGDVTRQVGILGRRFTFLGAAGVAASVAIIRGYSRAGDDVVKVSRRLGIGIEALQEYRFAAERSGVAQNVFDMAVQRLGRRVGEASQGFGEARGALTALNVELFDQAGQVRTIESLLPELADKLSKVESANLRNALAMKLFDSEGVRMVQLLESGSGGMEALRGEARRLGVVLSERAALGAEVFTDAQTNLGASILGVRNMILGQFVPALTVLVDRLTSFLVDNRSRMAAWVKDFADGLPEKLTRIWEGVRSLAAQFQPLIDFGRQLAERFGAVKVAGGILAALIAGPLVVSLGGLTVSVLSLGAALLATPIGWVIAGLAALGAAGVVLRDNWGAIWDWIGDKTAAVADWVMGKIRWVIDGVKGLADFLPESIRTRIGFDAAPAVASGSSSAAGAGPRALSPAAFGAQQGNAEVRVKFDNLPAGARVFQESSEGVDLGLDVGYAFAG